MKPSTILAIVALLLNPLRSDGAISSFHKNDVIVFQGDSITDGGRQREGQDFNHIMGQDYCYIIAAEMGLKFPELNLNFINRGIGGNTVKDLAGRWQNDTLNLKPTLLSILVGINDSLWGESVEDYAKIYDKLLADTIAALPGTRIILGEPFIMPVGNYKANYPAHRSTVRLRQNVVAQLAEKYHLPLVHYQKAFDDACELAPADHWSWDGVHPTYAGHALMVREWLRVVNGNFP